MGKVKVAAFSISLDGFGAAPNQSLENPFGVRGLELPRWFLATETFHTMNGKTGGARGIDNDFAARSFENIGAWILGRNMFGPVRGPWEGSAWNGWWGDNPPYHTPVFVLTHHPRPALIMEGGTTFHFITDGLESALASARQVAKEKDVRIGGGVSVVRQCLTAGHIDELHLALAPVLLGRGEHLFSEIDLDSLSLRNVKVIQGEQATHVLIDKS